MKREEDEVGQVGTQILLGPVNIKNKPRPCTPEITVGVTDGLDFEVQEPRDGPNPSLILAKPSAQVESRIEGLVTRGRNFKETVVKHTPHLGHDHGRTRAT